MIKSNSIKPFCEKVFFTLNVQLHRLNQEKMEVQLLGYLTVEEAPLEAESQEPPT